MSKNLIVNNCPSIYFKWTAMMGNSNKMLITEVEKYIFSSPEDVRNILLQIRQIIREEAPDAVEGFAYQMPSYKTNGKPLVYFAGFKKHIGFYATPSGHAAFSEELSEYKQGKGSVQFPLNKPIPFDLIRQMVAFRVEENKFAG